MIKVIQKILAHKIISIIILAILVFGGSFIIRALNNNKQETRYILGTAEKGTLINSISGTGQVSTSNQVDLKVKASGDVVYIAPQIKVGQAVMLGALLAQLDATDAYKAIRDAKDNLETAKLNLEKLEQPVDELSLLQVRNSLAQLKESRQNAQNNLQKAYDDGFNSVSNAFLDLPDIMTGLDGLLFKQTIASTQRNIDWYANQILRWEEARVLEYRNQLEASYNTAYNSYISTFAEYKATSRLANNETIENLILKTYDTTKLIAETIKNTNDFISFIKDILTQHQASINSIIVSNQTSLSTYTSKTNNQLSSLLSSRQNIENYKQTIINNDRSIAEKTISLADLESGPDPLDIRAQKLIVQQREDALIDAQENLANYFIRAPFDGVLAAVDIKKGDSLTQGTMIGTLIADKNLAEISLNEVDVARVKVGQKATLTFDAVEDLTLTGIVSEVDTLGTVSQGVATYRVKIVFDAQDDRIKPGMTVSASIIIEAKPDVLMIANSAVKSIGENGGNYVEILDNLSEGDKSLGISSGIIAKRSPRRQMVQIGLSNDSSTEIISGLNEGDIFILRTSTSSSVKSSTNLNNNQNQRGIMNPGFMMR